MIKINIKFNDEAFAYDLGEQIKRYITDAEVEYTNPDEKTDYFFTDNDDIETKENATKYKELPIVLFSKVQDFSDNADMVIQMPFKLNKFLENLKNNKLLPKIRRKECLIIKEYHLYPIKKEIVSIKTEKITKITEKEIDILKYLYQINPDSATKEDLLENVWKYNAEATTHTVETHIYRLRQKVEKNGESQLIITENNGYRLNA